jgi:hypothetical protein
MRFLIAGALLVVAGVVAFLAAMTVWALWEDRHRPYF